MSMPCGDCTAFVRRAERCFAGFLVQYGFQPLQCRAERGGRECLALYQSPHCRLLFMLSDGAESCALGSLATDFPPNRLFNLNGEIGWYDVLWLIEWLSNRRLLTQRKIEAIWQGRLDYFDWLLPLLVKWGDRLIDLFASSGRGTWRTEFAEYFETRR